jgi:hypothetical protein
METLWGIDISEGDYGKILSYLVHVVPNCPILFFISMVGTSGSVNSQPRLNQIPRLNSVLLFNLRAESDDD